MGIADDEFLAIDGVSAAPGVRNSQRMTLAYLGTLSAQRRLEMLVDMLKLIRLHGIEAKLLLVGDGQRPEDRLRLECRAGELGIHEHLEITGFLPRSEALARVSQAQVCLSPFFPTPILRSTSPTKLVEYLALGLPVVANDHPEQRRALRESRAGVCVPWGARHFARAVKWLMKLDDNEREAMGRRGRNWVLERRTYGKIAAELEAKYFELLVRS
jgi:glycosyltransferase involved in cell wall biosynthesis